MLESLKKKASIVAYAALNKLLASDKVLGLANSKVERYALVHSLRKTDQGFEALAQLKGSPETIQVTMQRISIADDAGSVSLHGFSSNMEWVQHLLEDFVEGQPIRIPEKYKDILLTIKKMLP